MRAGRQKTLALGARRSASPRRGSRETLQRLSCALDRIRLRPSRPRRRPRAAVTTFRSVATEWLERKVVGEGRAPKTVQRAKRMIELLGAEFASRPIADLEAPHVLALLRRTEARGQHESVKRAREIASAVSRFGIACGVCSRDPAADLRGALTSRKARPRSAITEPAEVGKLLRAIDGYSGVSVRHGLQLLALTFVRPCELALAEWSEFGADGVWTVPASRTKMRKEHHVPLPRQALKILAELRIAAAGSRYVFPARQRDRPIQVNRFVRVLRSLGYGADETTAHGFRSMASTLLNESGRFSVGAIELSLAHSKSDVRSRYNRSRLWPEHVELMKWYADHLDKLRGRGRVVKLAPKKKRTG